MRLARRGLLVVLLVCACRSSGRAPSDAAAPDTAAGTDGLAESDGLEAADGPVGGDAPSADGPLGSDGPAATDGPGENDGPGATDGPAGNDGPGATAGCTYDIVRPLALDDATSFGPTVRQLGTNFAIGTTWNFELSWAALGSQSEATWSPHDATSAARLKLDWGDSVVEYAGGHAPPGSRLACPAYVVIDTDVRLVSADGGFDESWHLDAQVGQLSQGQLSIRSDLRALGLYAFAGTYSFQWLAPWPVEKAYLLVTVYAASVNGPTSLDGALQEVSQRAEMVNDAGVSSGGSGDGVLAKVAAWSAVLP